MTRAARLVALLLAVVAGLAAALLIASGPTASYDGESTQCAGLIVSVSTDRADRVGGQSTSAVERGLAGACDRAEATYAWAAGGAVMVCVVLGSVVWFAGREDDAVADGAGAGVDGRQPVG